jgi:hypothetical protein
VVGDAILSCNPKIAIEVVAKGLIIGIGGKGCLHHGQLVLDKWFQIQLGEILLGKGNFLLLMPNDNDDPPQHLFMY